MKDDEIAASSLRPEAELSPANGVPLRHCDCEQSEAIAFRQMCCAP